MRKVIPLALLVIGAYALGALSVALFRTDSAIEEFKLGQTTFILRGWTSEDGNKLKELFEEAYPILQDIYGGEAIDVNNEEGFEVLVLREPSFSGSRLGRFARIRVGELKIQVVALKDAREWNAVHELSHMFFPNADVPTIFLEGLINATVILTGERLGEDFQTQFEQFEWRKQPGLDLRIGNKPALSLTDGVTSTLEIFENLREILYARAWADTFNQDSEILAKLRSRIILDYSGENQETVPVISLTESLFVGDWDALTETHAIFHDPPSGNQLIIVPAPPNDTDPERLVAVAFTAGKEEESIEDIPVRVSQWIDGVKQVICPVQTSEVSGVVLICTKEELSQFKGHTLRFRATTDFGSDEVTFEVTQEGEIRAAKGTQH